MPTALSTDLYELTMMAGYYAGGITGRATFELYARDLPPHRFFLVAAGLEQALDYLASLRFMPEEIAHLRALPNLQGVPSDFFDAYLANFRFTGEVWAIDEGTPVMALEPLLRVTAPAPEAQLVETALLAILTFQTSIASKAARIVSAAAGRPVIEFGARRAHGIDAGLYAARAAYIAGCDGTSNVAAGLRFGVPVTGTMAHSWIMMHADELQAFERYADLYGARSVFLVDTYDTIDAVKRIAASGLRPSAVRLDSGDIVSLSRRVRAILDEAGLTATKIFVTGDLDEHRIARLLDEGARADAFGVGSALSTSSDAPLLGGIYKLVEVERDGVRTATMKLSLDKRSYPGVKQVWRCFENDVAVRDVIALAGEAPPPGGVPLLRRVMIDGRAQESAPTLDFIRAECRKRVAQLPAGVRRLTGADTYPVVFSQTLQTLSERMASRSNS